MSTATKWVTCRHDKRIDECADCARKTWRVVFRIPSAHGVAFVEAPTPSEAVARVCECGDVLEVVSVEEDTAKLGWYEKLGGDHE